MADSLAEVEAQLDDAQRLDPRLARAHLLLCEIHLVHYFVGQGPVTARRRCGTRTARWSCGWAAAMRYWARCWRGAADPARTGAIAGGGADGSGQAVFTELTKVVNLPSALDPVMVRLDPAFARVRQDGRFERMLAEVQVPIRL